MNSEQIRALIQRGESAEIEFKESAGWSYGGFNQKIIVTVAAFLNIEKGGTLLIGVKDDGTLIGIEKDYGKGSDNRQKCDYYEQNFMTALLENIGKDCGPYIKLSFANLEGKEVCRVTISPCSRPVYFIENKEDKNNKKEYFYIRVGNSNRQLTMSEANEYIRNHWGSRGFNTGHTPQNNDSTTNHKDQNSMSPKERLKFIELLNNIPPQQLQKLIKALNPPSNIFPSKYAPQADQVDALISWAEGVGGCGLPEVEELFKILNP
jgi:predicted HTH transcriptional regulator